LLGAARTTEDPTVSFNTVADDAAPAMLADGSERMDRAFEAVEHVRLPAQADLEGLVVVVATDLALRHAQGFPRAVLRTNRLQVVATLGLPSSNAGKAEARTGFEPVYEALQASA
jgi:hypothetical protein